MQVFRKTFSYSSLICFDLIGAFQLVEWDEIEVIVQGIFLLVILSENVGRFFGNWPRKAGLISIIHII